MKSTHGGTDSSENKMGPHNKGELGCNQRKIWKSKDAYKKIIQAFNILSSFPGIKVKIELRKNPYFINQNHDVNRRATFLNRYLRVQTISPNFVHAKMPVLANGTNIQPSKREGEKRYTLLQYSKDIHSSYII